MARKTKIIKMEYDKTQEEVLKAQEKLQEIARLAEEAAEEEKKIMEDAEEEIQKIAEKKGFFCGVVLTRQDILNIVSLAMETRENISIPFKLFFKDKD